MNTSIEVKNYNIQTTNGQSNLVRNLVKQIGQRSENLPYGSTQKIVIDIRGQDVSLAARKAIIDKVIDKSGGAVRVNDFEFFNPTPNN